MKMFVKLLFVFIIGSSCDAQTTNNWWYSTTSPNWQTGHSYTLPHNTGSLRLSGGFRPSEGVVEVQVAGEWGTVCDDNFDNNALHVVCRQLGYSGHPSVRVTTMDYNQTESSAMRIWLDGFHCSGYENRLVDCQLNNGLGQHDCSHSEDVKVDCLGLHNNNYMYNMTSTPGYYSSHNWWDTTPGYYTSHHWWDTTPPTYWDTTPSTHGSHMQVTADPQNVVPGRTRTLRLTCAPGLYDDLSRILLIQLNHLYNGTKLAVADIDSGQSARVVNGHYRTSVSGYIPYEPYRVTEAYLSVSIEQPATSDSGLWECTLSGLTHSGLMTTQTATTVVYVSNLEGLDTEVEQLRQQLQTAEATVNDLKNAVGELQRRSGQGFTAFLINNYTAGSGRLPFQRVLLNTLGGFYNSVLHPPVDGLYHLTLTVSVNGFHHVTVALRQDNQVLVTVIASASGREDGQASASVVVFLTMNSRVDAEVVEYSPGAMLLSYPSTLLSGYLV